MAEKSEPRGRGALLDLLKKHKEARAGGAATPEEQLPPKSRGRAALLQKLQSIKEKKVGAIEKTGLETVSDPNSVCSRGDIERTAQSVSQLSLASSSVSTEPVLYRGRSGVPIRTATNYIRLDIEKDRGVYRYEVRFEPDIDARSYRIKLVNQVLGEMNTTKVYDGDVILYLPSQIFEDRQEFTSVIPNTDQPVRIMFIYKCKQKLSECLHLYNVLFKRIMHVLLYSRMGRNYFSPDHKQIIPQHKLEVLPGFAVHVDEMEGGLMLCMDTQHRVIRCQTVYELLHEIRAANPRNFKEEARKNIIGACVLTKYNNKTYTVDDLNFEMTPSDTFPTRNGGTCTFLNYYKEHHNITIQDVEQPMLVNKMTRMINEQKTESLICLVPELCYLTGLTDVMRSDFKVMKDVAAFTRVTPNQRALALRTYLERVRKSELAQKVLSSWGLKLADGITDIQARVLPQEAIYFGNQAEERKFVGADWNKAVSDNKLTGPIDIVNWQLYYTRRDQKNATNFAQTIVRLAKGMGCIIRDPQHIVLDDDRTETYMVSIKNNVSAQVQVAVFVCPTIRSDRYSLIKKMCCVNNPMASQVILSKTLANQQKVRSIIHKIGMQITCKLGGSLWCVKIPVTNWMVCGIDVYHGVNKQSVCGFVASTNDSMTTYYSEAMFQDGEIGDFLKTSFRKSLLHSKQKTGCVPNKVVVFRDGVGDGQLEHCRRYEVAQFREVISELKLNTTITYIVVQKRINTRIFKMIDDSNFENPPAGTVIDSTVTRRNLADFYLVPQSVRQGTVNPTHYIIIHDEANMNPDHLQRLAYKLCHLYFNWSGTVRVPAPCLYAHKLAALVGQYIKKVPGNELCDKLYYL